MFGTNEIVGKKFFKEAPANSLLVTSIFYTIQGEGPYSGKVAIFVRLAKCNLACSFCDTFFDKGDWMSYDEIEAKVNDIIDDFYIDQDLNVPRWAKFLPGYVLPNNDAAAPDREVVSFAGQRCVQNKKRDVVLVVTGGEPTLQSNLTEFLCISCSSYTAVQIESNGTIDLELPERVTLVCSPKCAEKDGMPTKYLNPTKQILERANCLKFVMTADPHSPYHTIPEWAHEWASKPGNTVYVSPMNIYNEVPNKAKVLRLTKKGEDITMDERSTVDEVISFWEPGLLDMKANQANHEYAAQYCMRHGFTLQLQVHLYASLA